MYAIFSWNTSKRNILDHIFKTPYISVKIAVCNKFWESSHLEFISPKYPMISEKSDDAVLTCDRIRTDIKIWSKLQTFKIQFKKTKKQLNILEKKSTSVSSLKGSVRQPPGSIRIINLYYNGYLHEIEENAKIKMHTNFPNFPLFIDWWC